MAFTSVVVFGAGTMGHSLALLFARAGCSVTLADTNPSTLEQARRRILVLAETLHRELGGDSAARVAARLACTDDGFSAVAGADMVVEAISENVEIKRAFYRGIQPVLPREAVLASNTSVLNIFDHAPAALHARLVMTHYFVPPHLVPLVEIVGHPSNPPELLPRLTGFLRALGMTPVVMARFLPGFIINRIQRAMNQEIFRIMESGAAGAGEIDQAISASLGFRLLVMNYLERLDYTGLDLVLSNYRQEPLGLVTDESPPAILEHMVARGELGFRSGKGFYDYMGESRENAARSRDEKLIAVRRFLDALHRGAAGAPAGERVLRAKESGCDCQG